MQHHEVQLTVAAPQRDLRPRPMRGQGRSLARGLRCITAGVAERLADALGTPADQPAHLQLSKRERQVFLH